MHRDGVHLSATSGMYRYYKSLRGAMVHAESDNAELVRLPFIISITL